jgi:glycosyltransferase involved in cell wall biosynthesis
MYVLHSLYDKGGLTIVEIVKANALVDKGHDVVFCYTDKMLYPYTPKPLSPKIKCIHIDAPEDGVNPRSLDFFKRLVRFTKLLQRAVNEEKPDVLVAVGFVWNKVVVPLIRAPRGKKMIRVREFHGASTMYKCVGIDPKRLKLHYWYHAIGRTVQSWRYDRIFLLTQKDKKENYPHNNKFDVVPNPLTIDSPQYSDAPRSKTVIFVGRLSYEKNLPALLRIWSKTDRQGWILKIVGDGEERELLQRYAETLNISDSVEFVGWVENPIPIMYDASLLCLTSLYEGFALVLIEAMAAGLPVISYDLSYGPSDIIEDGVNGFLIKNHDEQGFADKLSQLFSHREQLSDMSRTAYAVSDRFSVDEITDIWIKKYTELLQAKG